MEDYDSYFKYAKLLTDVHAKPKIHNNKMDIEKNTVFKKYYKSHYCFYFFCCELRVSFHKFYFLFSKTPIKGDPEDS